MRRLNAEEIAHNSVVEGIQCPPNRRKPAELETNEKGSRTRREQLPEFAD
jgi:hypothetical protein